jgi:hypothetical protein
MLSNDTDKMIKTELSHQLKYLFADFDKNIIQLYFLKIVMKFLNIDR